MWVPAHALPSTLARGFFALVLALACTVATAGASAAQGGYDFPGDRADGTPVSMFGTYVRSGEYMLYGFYEYVLPLQRSRDLIGTSAWQFKLGTGFVRTFSFGTMTLRLAAEYDRAERKIEPGEYAIEWLKRISPTVRVYAGIEGSQDEVAVVPVIMWAPHPHVALHLNSAFGVSSKMEDWAPEVGVMISLP